MSQAYRNPMSRERGVMLSEDRAASAAHCFAVARRLRMGEDMPLGHDLLPRDLRVAILKRF